MKMLTKLALVSSMLLSANAMAMQAMDDASMSATTGQDGLNIGIKLDNAGISIDKLYLHDNDGLKLTLVLRVQPEKRVRLPSMASPLSKLRVIIF